MAEAARKIDELESQVLEAIELCDGDLVAALRASLIYNDFLEQKLERFRGMISSGFHRGRVRRPAPSQTAESTKPTDPAINSP
jgi:hypothetical protein